MLLASIYSFFRSTSVPCKSRHFTSVPRSTFCITVPLPLVLDWPRNHEASLGGDQSNTVSGDICRRLRFHPVQGRYYLPSHLICTSTPGLQQHACLYHRKRSCTFFVPPSKLGKALTKSLERHILPLIFWVRNNIYSGMFFIRVDLMESRYSSTAIKPIICRYTPRTPTQVPYNCHGNANILRTIVMPSISVRMVFKSRSAKKEKDAFVCLAASTRVQRSS